MASEPLLKRARNAQASSMPTFSTLPVRLCLRSLTKVSVIAHTLSIVPIQPESGVDAVRQQVARHARPRRFDVQTPQTGPALWKVRADGPVLQEFSPVMKYPAETALIDQLLGKRDGWDAPVVVPNDVGTLAFSTAATIFSPCTPSMDKGFSHRIIFPAFAAAAAISAWRLFGTQMSIRSMSGAGNELAPVSSMD